MSMNNVKKTELLAPAGNPEKLKIAVLYGADAEIGLGGVSKNTLQRQFTDLEGWTNQYIAARADEVILMISGIPVKIK